MALSGEATMNDKLNREIKYNNTWLVSCSPCTSEKWIKQLIFMVPTDKGSLCLCHCFKAHKRYGITVLYFP